MKKLACALAAAATLVGGSLAATSEAEARPYRYYAKPGYYGAYAYPRYRSYGAYAYPRYGYYRGYRRNAGAAVAAGVAGALIGGAIAAQATPAYGYPAYGYYGYRY
jgi:hypothetical protein